MKTPTHNPNPALARLSSAVVIALVFSGCATSSLTQQRPPLPSPSPAGTVNYPRQVGPLGTVGILVFLEDSPLRIQQPLARGEAVKQAITEGARALVPEPRGESEKASSAPPAAVVMIGAVNGVQTAFAAAWAPFGAALGAGRGAWHGIPEAKFYPALNGVTNVQNQIPITEETTRRLITQMRAATGTTLHRDGALPLGQYDTYLELYHSDRALSGDRTINPTLQLRLGYRCRLLRASDYSEIDTFRVAYRSDGRKFVEWGANNGAPLRGEMDRGMAEIVNQMTTELARYDLRPTRPPLTVSTTTAPLNLAKSTSR